MDINRTIKIKFNLILLIIVTFIFSISLIIWSISFNNKKAIETERIFTFDGQKAFSHVLKQVEFGPRIPNSIAHQETIHYIKDYLDELGWSVEMQEKEMENNLNIRNIVSKLGEGNPLIIIGAHYDSRIYADRDPVPANRTKPVPGANDGASGVAILLELGRILSNKNNIEPLNKEIWLVFFDLEDNGGIDNYDWILGSRFFVQSLTKRPDYVVILDMVGDNDLKIYKERNSNLVLSNEIWQVAQILDYSDYFIPSFKYRIYDDHIPFIEKDITAVDIIDFDYRFWHTTNDLPENVSSNSLQVIGDIILNWIFTK